MTSIHQYDDIISIPRPDLKRHSRMPISDRAAQFKPFAALTGYASVIEEAARVTDQEIILDESEKAEIDMKLRSIRDNIQRHPEITLVYFLPDAKKSGGSIQTVSGIVSAVDIRENNLILDSGSKISFDSIIEIQ